MGTWTWRLPEATSSVARIDRWIGPTRRFAQASPSQIAEKSIVRASSTNTVAKPSSRLCRCASKRSHMRETLAASSRLSPLADRCLAPRRGTARRPPDRANADEYVADPEKAAEGLPVDRILEIGRVGFCKFSFSFDPARDLDRRSVSFHQRRRREAEGLCARTEVSLELLRRGAKQQRCARYLPRSDPRLAVARGIVIPDTAASPGSLR